MWHRLPIIAEQQGLVPIDGICHPGPECSAGIPLVTSPLGKPPSALIKQCHDLGKVSKTRPVHNVWFAHCPLPLGLARSNSITCFDPTRTLTVCRTGLSSLV